jgi:hypothetical protein
MMVTAGIGFLEQNPSLLHLDWGWHGYSFSRHGPSWPWQKVTRISKCTTSYSIGANVSTRPLPLLLLGLRKEHSLFRSTLPAVHLIRSLSEPGVATFAGGWMQKWRLGIQEPYLHFGACAERNSSTSWWPRALARVATYPDYILGCSVQIVVPSGMNGTHKS